MSLLSHAVSRVTPECKGVFYRASVSLYNTQRGFAKHVEMNKLKRMSCPGCAQCGFIDDAIAEELACGKDILGLDSVEHAKVYRIETVNITTDFESGYVDGYDLKLVEAHLTSQDKS